MYFVNRSEIDARISYIDTLLNMAQSKQTFSSSMDRLALERIIHSTIEAMLDVGNSMIDGFIMRDPGSYHDIIDILIDEKVIPEADESNYKSFIDLRQIIVQDYLQVDHAHLEKTLLTNIDTLKHFSHHIRTYLDNELGVANAFSNE